MRKPRWIERRYESAQQAAPGADGRLAERAGFEPADPKRITSLAMMRIQPLCHLSATGARRISVARGADKSGKPLRACFGEEDSSVEGRAMLTGGAVDP